MGTELTLAPIRSLEDFVLSSARFQLPRVSELDKWNRRVISNLLYYQTNYFILAIILFVLIGIINPSKMVLGLTAISIAILMFAYANSKSPKFVEFKKSHPILSLMLIFIGGYLIVYMFSGVIVFLFGILLPTFLALLHASLRLRNLRNKISEKLEDVGLTTTPMGLLLNSFGSEPHLY